MNKPDRPSIPLSVSLSDSVLDELVEQFTLLVEQGRDPDVEEFAARHAKHAEVLRRILPAVKALAGLAVANEPNDGAPSAPRTALEVRELGDFRLLREIGRGGMGIVYEAEQLSLGRRVAVKVLPFAAILDERQLQRFKNEARAAATLDHPHIVPVYSVGVDRGVHYFAMRFIEGRSLAEVIAEWRRSAAPQLDRAIDSSSHADRSQSSILGPESSPPPNGRLRLAVKQGPGTTAVLARGSTDGQPDTDHYRQIARWGIQAAQALEHAHQLGIVHRDVKPSNLLLGADGHLWVTDFGLAMTGADSDLTMTGDLLGTPRYMSPEQARGDHRILDQRSDVYSLGITLYELLTLEPAYAGLNRQETLLKIAKDDPSPPRRLNPAIPRDVETIVVKAIDRDPLLRYQSAGEFADDLDRFLKDRPIRARRTTLTQLAVKWTRRHRGLVTTAFGVLLLAVVGLSIATILIARERNAARDSAWREREAAGRARDALTAAQSSERALKKEREETLAARNDARGQAAQAMREAENARMNFAALLRAAGRFTDLLSNPKFLNNPESKELRQALIEESIALYEDFLSGAKNERDLSIETGVAHARLAYLEWNRGHVPAVVAHCEAAIQNLDSARVDPDRRELVLSELARAYSLNGKQLRLEAERIGQGFFCRKPGWASKQNRLYSRSLPTMSLPPGWLLITEVRCGRADMLIQVPREDDLPRNEPIVPRVEAIQHAKDMYGRAERELQESETLYRTLVRENPENVEYQTSVALVLSDLSHILSNRAFWLAGNRRDPANTADRKRAAELLQEAANLLGRIDEDTRPVDLAIDAAKTHPYHRTKFRTSLLVRAAMELGESGIAGSHNQVCEKKFREGIELLETLPVEWQIIGDDTAAGWPMEPQYVTFLLGLKQLFRRMDRRTESLECVESIAAFCDKAADRIRETEATRPRVELNRMLAENPIELLAVRIAETYLDLVPELPQKRAELQQKAIQLLEQFRCDPTHPVYREQLHYYEELVTQQNAVLTSQIKAGEANAVDEQKKLLERATKAYPNATRLHEFLSRHLIARGQPEEAVDLLRKFARRQVSDPDAQMALAIVLQEAGRFEEAVAEAEAAAVLEPDFAPLQCALASIVGRAGNRDRARDVLLKAADACTSAIEIHDVVNELYRTGWRNEAIVVCRRAIADNPRDDDLPAFHSKIGDLLVAGDSWHEALAEFEQAQKLTQHNPTEYSLKIANAYSRLERFEESLAEVRKWADIQRRDPRQLPRVEAELRAAERRVEVNRLLSGPLEEALSRSPSELHEFAEFCLYSKRMPGTAVRLFEKAMQDDPSRFRSPQAYKAARAAALASSGVGIDVAELDDSQRLRLREQAFKWLHMELERLVNNVAPQDPAEFLRIIKYWLIDSYLSSVRDPESLGNLSSEERNEWEALWNDVRQHCDAAEGRGKSAKGKTP